MVASAIKMYILLTTPWFACVYCLKLLELMMFCTWMPFMMLAVRSFVWLADASEVRLEAMEDAGA